MQQQLTEIPLNRITVGNNYRKTLAEKSLKELAASIEQHGVQEPVIVRADGAELHEARKRFGRMCLELDKLTRLAGEIADHLDALAKAIEAQRDAIAVMEGERRTEPRPAVRFGGIETI